MNKMKKIKDKSHVEQYYSLKNILKIEDAKYFLIIGERSNGKSYAVLKHCLEEYLKHNKKIGYIRRWEDELKPSTAGKAFDNLVFDGTVERLTHGEYNTIVYRNRQYYLATRNEEDGELVYAPEPFAYAFAVNIDERYKSASYPDIGNIAFDEFVSRNGIMQDEFVKFCGIISTIVRSRDNVKIFMMGNTVNKHSIYFKEMGLNNISKMEKGEINVYESGNAGKTLKVAVEFSDGPSKGKPSDVYFAFDNPKLSMITTGEWEIPMYPRKPIKYDHNDVKFSYFIEFEEDIFQCDIIQKDDAMFTFIYQRNQSIDDEYFKDKLIFSQIPRPYPNYRRSLIKPYDSIGKKIAYFYMTGDVYYQNNTVGHAIATYLEWCKMIKN